MMILHALVMQKWPKLRSRLRDRNVKFLRKYEFPTTETNLIGQEKTDDPVTVSEFRTCQTLKRSLSLGLCTVVF